MTQTLLRVLAILIAGRGIGNLLKRLGTGSGLVVLLQAARTSR
jgi:hypothetical protein